MKIGYQGVKGAFSDIAARTYFGNVKAEAGGWKRDHIESDEGAHDALHNTGTAYSSDRSIGSAAYADSAAGYEEVCYSEFVDMLRDLDLGTIDYAMFPVENTTTGIIARTYDYFQYYNVHAVGEVVVPIRECLIALPGTSIDEIRSVYSHPEALSQCNGMFKRYPQMKPVVYEDTALSVAYIRDAGDPHKAALASDLAAEIYGMEIIERDAQDNDANMTRFLCLSGRPEYPANADKVSIRMVTSHSPGSLYKALGIFASLDINVLKLESRPIIGKLFEYCFYLDFAGNLHDRNVREALRRLEFDCRELNIFGNYKSSELAL